MQDEKKRLKIVVGMATCKGRERHVKKACESLKHQVDVIHVYDNEKESVNLTDNGKFYFLQNYTEPIYYFTCDDDIFYPPTYIQDTIKLIDEYESIITYHGRILLGAGLNYYKGHMTFRCLGKVNKHVLIHVPGTGVTGFRTDFFNPTEIWSDSRQKMTDLLCGIEAVKQGVQIVCAKHEVGYFRDLNAPISTSIYHEQVKNCGVQNSIADEIYTLKYCTDNN